MTTDPGLLAQLPYQWHPLVHWAAHARQFRAVLPGVKGPAAFDLLEAARTAIRDQPEMAAWALSVGAGAHPISQLILSGTRIAGSCAVPGCTICTVIAMRRDLPPSTVEQLHAELSGSAPSSDLSPELRAAIRSRPAGDPTRELFDLLDEARDLGRKAHRLLWVLRFALLGFGLFLLIWGLL